VTDDDGEKGEAWGLRGGEGDAQQEAVGGLQGEGGGRDRKKAKMAN
jgi:hypothetical protein